MQKTAFLAIIILMLLSFSANSAVHRYRITIDEKIAIATISICFDGKAPRYLAVESKVGDYDLVTFPYSKQGNIEIQGRYWKTRYLEDDACIDYQTNLGRYHTNKIKKGPRRKNIAYIEDNTWLWLPETISPEDQIELEFTLPAWAEISTPWQQLNFSEHRFLLGHQPQEWGYTLMIGDFEVKHPKISEGHHLNIASTHNMVNSVAVNRWLTDTAKDLYSYLGGYPVPQTQIIVNSKDKLRSGPVPWGDFSRGNGFGIRFVVIPKDDIRNFYSDWTAPHEFSHQLLPKLNYNDIWLSEGLASYLQYVLMGQSGALAKNKAWARLYSAFKRTDDSTKRLTRESLTESSKQWGNSHRSGRRMRVYWSGALMFLKADIALREKSNGQVGLNDILLKLNRCCIKGSKIWRGKTLSQQLDKLSQSKIFSQLYQQFSVSHHFPDFKDSFTDLGITVKQENNAELIFGNNSMAVNIMTK
jgi:hypothetical protein